MREGGLPLIVSPRSFIEQPGMGQARVRSQESESGARNSVSHMGSRDLNHECQQGAGNERVTRIHT